MTRAYFARLALLLVTLATFAAAHPPTECATTSERRPEAAIVPLRSDGMPDLPRSGIWLARNETLCILASPSPEERRSLEAKQVDSEHVTMLEEVAVVRRSTAASLRLHLDSNGNATELHIDNLSPYRIGVIIDLTSGFWIEPGQSLKHQIPTGEDGVLISHLGRQQASPRPVPTSAPEPPKKRPEPKEYISFAPLTLAQYSNVDGLYRTLAPLGYDHPGNGRVTWGGLYSLTIDDFFLSGRITTSSRKSSGGEESELRAAQGTATLRAGMVAYERGPWRLIPNFGVGTFFHHLKFSKTSELPPWTDGYRKPKNARVTGTLGILSEVMLRRSLFLRAELGAQLFLTKGSWSTSVRSEDDKGEVEEARIKLRGPSVGSNSPYLMLSLGFRFQIGP